MVHGRGSGLEGEEAALWDAMSGAAKGLCLGEDELKTGFLSLP